VLKARKNPIILNTIHKSSLFYPVVTRMLHGERRLGARVRRNCGDVLGGRGADALVVEKANREVFTVEKSGGAAGRR
jgi:hypothetical protein